MKNLTQKDLAKYAVSKINAAEALNLVEMVECNAYLLYIALYAEFHIVRKAAASKLTSDKMRYKFVRCSEDVPLKIEITKKINTQCYLEEISLYDPCVKCKIEAIYKLKNEQILINLFLSSKVLLIRMAVLESLGERKLLNIILENSSDLDLRLAIASVIRDEKLLKAIVIDEKQDEFVRRRAFERIKDSEIIDDLLQNYDILKGIKDN